jgi:membrane associated rhomboid family serine protease
LRAPDVTEVFRSVSRAASDERALMLTAVAIPCQVDFDGMQFTLHVDEADAARALDQLQRYEMESRLVPALPLPPLPKLHTGAWMGCVAYLAVLVAVPLMISNGVWRPDAFDTGDLDGARVQAGQWWRAWTALTLHLDASHLASNLGAGIWFGYLAGRLLGSGRAWLLIVTGGALANLLEAQFGPADHRAVGASTAVFAALGLMAAYSWRTRFHIPQRWALRWGPLIAGAALLGLTGSGGEDTDLIGHVAGFIVGCIFGTVTATRVVARLLNLVPQWLAGMAALASVVVAWACALGS